MSLIADPQHASSAGSEPSEDSNTAPPAAPRPPLEPGKSVEVFYDGDCPLCKREIDLLRWMDGKNRIQFTDIAAEGFEPSTYGKTMAELMAEIHGRLPDGRWIIGVEVFRQLYAATGLSWLVGPTRLPGISHALDFGYQVFAKQRLRFTGRCEAGTCELPANVRAEKRT